MYQHHHNTECCLRCVVFTSQCSADGLHRTSHTTVLAHLSEVSKTGSVSNKRVVNPLLWIFTFFYWILQFSQLHNILGLQPETHWLHYTSKLINIREHPQALEHNQYHHTIRMIYGIILSLANQYAPKISTGKFSASSLVRGVHYRTSQKIRFPTQFCL